MGGREPDREECVREMEGTGLTGEQGEGGESPSDSVRAGTESGEAARLGAPKRERSRGRGGRYVCGLVKLDGDSTDSARGRDCLPGPM